MHAIETRYKGCHFRSRLEARWAVGFDAMRYQWHYEPEGYDLGEHGLYLPDFYLPAVEGGIFVEVKGDSRDWDMCRKAEAKLVALSRVTGKKCALVFQPSSYSIKLEADDCSPLGYWIGAVELLSRAAIDAAKSARFEHCQCGASA